MIFTNSLQSRDTFFTFHVLGLIAWHDFYLAQGRDGRGRFKTIRYTELVIGTGSRSTVSF
ncbi:hypothetical protein LBMAG31_09180 [Nitrosomonadaceae bacterium]|nr:hypothetical protein LBMAG31_09180 [Nitrosomonadaceae bacterium]